MSISPYSQFNQQNFQTKNHINDKPKQQKSDNVSMIGKSFLSLYAAGLVNEAVKKVGCKPFSNIIKKPNNQLLSESIEVFDKVLPKTGLEKKGVTIVSAKNPNEILTAFERNYDKLNKYLCNKSPEYAQILKRKFLGKANSIMEGRNSSYLLKSKEIVINKEKGASLLFHELGHALNSNKKGLGRILHILRRPFVKLYPLIIWTALLKPKKQDGEKAQGFFDKTTTFIKNNCGKLTFAIHLPLLLEEGLASIKGTKLAKGLLSRNSLKSLNKLHFMAWTTYLAGVTGIILQTVTISKLQDKFRQSQKSA